MLAFDFPFNQGEGLVVLHAEERPDWSGRALLGARGDELR